MLPRKTPSLTAGEAVAAVLLVLVLALALTSRHFPAAPANDPSAESVLDQLVRAAGDGSGTDVQISVGSGTCPPGRVCPPAPSCPPGRSCPPRTVFGDFRLRSH